VAGRRGDGAAVAVVWCSALGAGSPLIVAHLRVGAFDDRAIRCSADLLTVDGRRAYASPAGFPPPCRDGGDGHNEVLLHRRRRHPPFGD